MGTTCCREEYAEECEVFVCADAPVPFNLSLHSRLPFGLLASSWLPSPLGIFLWSTLYVMLLIVGGPAFWVLELLTVFLVISVGLFIVCCFLFGFCAVYGLLAVAFDLVCLLGESIRFCWSLVSFLACHKPIGEWRGGERLTVSFWKGCKDIWREVSSTCVAVEAIGVPCMSGSLYERTKNQKLKTWARWCEEVVHMHKAIVL